VQAFDDRQYREIYEFSLNWLYRLFAKGNVENFKKKYPIEKYHKWSTELPEEHRLALSVKNRFCFPPEQIAKAIVNRHIINLLRRLSIDKWNFWKNEGLGTLGFRLIRPGFEDGYPFTCKAWGPARNVVSFCVPIVEHSKIPMIELIPGSHLADYEKVMPQNTKFAKEEFHLVQKPKDLSSIQPELCKGEILVFHPKLIHSENIYSGDITRFSLEYRINPLH